MTKNIKIDFKLLANGQGLSQPFYQTPGSAGMDLYAAIEEDIVLAPFERKIIPTGFAMGMPEGVEAQIRPRSGLAAKHGITVLNTPATIDSDYRGEILVTLINLGQGDFSIQRGDRIAQMVIAPVTVCKWHQVDQLDETLRGTGAMGSTGTR